MIFKERIKIDSMISEHSPTHFIIKKLRMQRTYSFFCQINLTKHEVLVIGIVIKSPFMLCT